MKKLMKIAAFTTACAMLISGCSAPTQSTDNSAVLDATDAVKTYSGTTEIEFTAVSEGTEISMGTKGDIDICAVPSNLAANLYNKTNGEILVLAANVYGVVSIVERGENSISKV